MKLWTDAEVVEWCKVQQFAHDYEGLWIVFAAMACLGAYLLLQNYPAIIENDKLRERISKALSVAPFILLAGFIYLVVGV